MIKRLYRILLIIGSILTLSLIAGAVVALTGILPFAAGVVLTIIGCCGVRWLLTHDEL